MKYSILFAATSVLICFNVKESAAQSTTSNNTSFAFPQMLGFDGTTSGGGTAKPLEIRNDFNQPIEFFTNGIQRMNILETTGYVGLNTPTPMCRLHSLDGDVVFEGLLNSGSGVETISTLPVAGVGYRMMWVDSLAAFRVGSVDAATATWWNADEIGKYSVAMGNGVRASDRMSICTSNLNDKIEVN